MIYKFAEFTLDTSLNKLFKDEQTVKLGDKSFKLLFLLVQNSPRTVSKQEVMDEVWKNRIVTESTLYKTISRMRKELEGAGLTIESVFSEGYRISGVVKKVMTEEFYAIKDVPVKKSQNFISKFQWLLLSLIIIATLSYLLVNHKPKLTISQTITEMRNALSINKKAFLSQINQRNELGKMLAKRFEIDPDLSWERRIFVYYDQMNNEELFVFDQIRAYTEGPMLTNNQKLLDLINNNNQVLKEISDAATLRNHLTIWLNKYHKIFKNSKKMCLLYVGVEDGAPYPSAVDQQIIDWTETHQ